MSKIPLPDDILDAVAGGVFTIEGQQVTDLSLSEKGMSISCAGQTVTHEWSADERQELLKNPKEFGMFKSMMDGMQSSSTRYDLSEVMKGLKD
jgi:hypothetical protein